MASFGAYLSGQFWRGASGPCPAGGVLINTGLGYWVPYSGNASSFPGGQLAISLSQLAPGAYGQLQTSGFVDPDVFNLGTGAPTTVVPGVVPSRGSAPAMGTCDASGLITLWPSYAASTLGGPAGNPFPVAPAAGQTQVWGPGSESYSPQGHRPVLNVLSFGAPGTVGVGNAAADTAAIQAALNMMTNLALTESLSAEVYFPAGTYKINATLYVIGDYINSVPITPHLRGETHGQAGAGSTLQWVGTPGQDLLYQQMTYQGTIENITFDCNSSARSGIHIGYSSSAGTYRKLNFLRPQVLSVWQPSTVYAAGAIVVAPVGATTGGVLSDNGRRYQCTTPGTSGVSQPSWSTSTYANKSNATTGSFTNGGNYFINETSAPNSDGLTTDGSVTWTEIAESPASMIFGSWSSNSIGGNQQCDTALISECFFAGRGMGSGGGWGLRFVDGANCKSFHFDHLVFQSHYCALDMSPLDGAQSLEFTFFGSNCCDMRMGPGSFEATAFSSEQSAMLLCGGGGGASQTRIAGYWDGITGPSDPYLGLTSTGGILGPQGTAVVRYTGQLTLENFYIKDSNTNNNFPYIQFPGSLASNGPNTNKSSFRSSSCVYWCKGGFAGPYVIPIFDGSNNSLMPGAPTFENIYSGVDQAFLSQNDMMLENSGPQTRHALAQTTGSSLASARCKLPIVPGAGTTAGVSVGTAGQVVRHLAKFTIPSSVVAGIGGSSAQVQLVALFNRAVIHGIWIEVTTAFAFAPNTPTCTVAIGNIIPLISGTTTANAYLVATSTKATTPSTLIGMSSGDLGAALSSTVQGGAMVWGAITPGSPTSLQQWALIATFASNGNLNGLTAGSLDVYIDYSIMQYVSDQ